jgi:hypothetical protein
MGSGEKQPGADESAAIVQVGAARSPAVPGAQLESEKIVVSAPMSFHGSAARIWRITDLDSDNTAALIGIGALAALLIALAWMVVLGWYLIFGLLLVPYRLVRRSQRKRKLEEARHRELLASVNRSTQD